jgi:hypothetical protein
MRVFVDRHRGTFHALGSGMICFRNVSAVLVLMAAACGAKSASDGAGGGAAVGGNGGSVTVGGAGNAGSDVDACSAIQASDYDQSCVVNSDCVAVAQGDTCRRCACQSGAINRAALAGYHPVFGSSGPVCFCPFFGVPTCVAGVCTLCGGASLCAGVGAADAGAAGSGDATTLPGCSWPANLNPTDASSGQCNAARTLLSCKGSNGGGAGCISNDPTQCAGLNAQPGVSFTCSDQCAANEYGAACGFGPGPAPEPPAGCRTMSVTPGGTLYYCCPCSP